MDCRTGDKAGRQIRRQLSEEVRMEREKETFRR